MEPCIPTVPRMLVRKMSLTFIFCTVILLVTVIDAGPTIECDDQMMVMTVHTVNPFSGRVYVKGEYANPDCISNYVANPANQSASITVLYNKCNVKRLRMSSQGIQYTTVIVVSFHSTFETKVDRAYKINCLFQQINNSFTVPSIEVSMIATTELTQNVGQIQCTYEVRRGSIEGPQVRYALIGEAVYHVWKCEANNMRMLVRDCFVDDGQGNKVVTIDSLGCSTDRYVIQTPTYVGPDYSMAWTESHVFKYADRPQVVFQCQIHMCDAADPDCQNKSPPRCNGTLAHTIGPTPGVEGLGAEGRNRTKPPLQQAPGIPHTSVGPLVNFTGEGGFNQTQANFSSFHPAELFNISREFNQSTIILQSHTTSGLQSYTNGLQSFTNGSQVSANASQVSANASQVSANASQASANASQASTIGTHLNESETFSNISANFSHANLSGLGNATEFRLPLRNFSQPIGNETIEQHAPPKGLVFNETITSHDNATNTAATLTNPGNGTFSAPSGYGNLPQTRPIAGQPGQPAWQDTGAGFGNVTGQLRMPAGFGNVSEHSADFNETKSITQKKPFVDVFGNPQTTNAPRPSAFRLYRRSLKDDPQHLDNYVWDVLSNEITVMELDDDKGLNERKEKQDNNGRSLSVKLDTFDDDKKQKKSICIPGYSFAITVGISIFSVLLSTTISVIMCNKKTRKVPFL